MAEDDPMLLLNLPKSSDLPRAVTRYLDTRAGQMARRSYKCRVRKQWFAIPDVRVPHYFLSYMSGVRPRLVQNEACCTHTNSVLGVRLRCSSASQYLSTWHSAFVQLSAEIEGHPLGGGMLKLEPGEAAQIVLPRTNQVNDHHPETIANALNTMRKWRHIE